MVILILEWKRKTRIYRRHLEYLFSRNSIFTSYWFGCNFSGFVILEIFYDLQMLRFITKSRTIQEFFEAQFGEQVWKAKSFIHVILAKRTDRSISNRSLTLFEPGYIYCLFKWRVNILAKNSNFCPILKQKHANFIPTFSCRHW